MPRCMEQYHRKGVSDIKNALDGRRLSLTGRDRKGRVDMKFIMIAAAGMIAMIAAGANPQGTKKITGEVVDVSCYVAEGARGEGHKACATACLKAGEPGGILEEKTGNVYLVVTGDHSNPATKLLPHVAKTVEVTGTINKRGGIRTIDITEIKEIESREAGRAKE